MDEATPDISALTAAALLDDLPVPMILYALDGRAVAINAAAEQFWGVDRRTLIGSLNLHTDATAQSVDVAATLARVGRGERVYREPTRDSVAPNTPDAREIWYQAVIFPVRGADGQVAYAGYIYSDVTHQIEQQQQLARTEEENAAQRHLIAELAIPVVQVWEGILLAPLVGSIDGRRAALVVEQLLDAIVRESADVVILDITGVPIVDTQVANRLIQTAQAARLLGAEVVLTGIRPEVAQTLVGLGVDLGAITTYSTLESAIGSVLGQAGDLPR